MGWRAPEFDLMIKALDPEDFTFGPNTLIPVSYVPRVCVLLDQLGDAVLDALTWDWPEWPLPLKFGPGEAIKVNHWPPGPHPVRFEWLEDA